MKKFFILFFIFLLCRPLAWSSGLYFHSLGSRASAMGSAFVGLADDFSAVFLNPAGIAQFDTQYFGFFGGGLIPQGSYKRDLYAPGRGRITWIDAETQNKHYFSGSAAYCHPLGDQWTAGIGISTPRHFQMNWRSDDLAPMANDNASINWMSKIRTAAISPSIAYKMRPSLLIGASIHINYGLFALERHAGTFNFPLPDPPYIYPIELGQYKERISGWGYGATFGILFKPAGFLSLGAVLKTGSTIKYKGEARIDGFPELGTAFSRDLKEVSKIERKLTWPLSLALGTAFKPHHALTLTADLRWTRWSGWDALKAEYQDPHWHSYMSERGNDEMELSWNDTLQFRFGAEYFLSKAIAVRGGFFAAPSPSPEKTLNVLIPAYNFRAMTFGCGYRIKDIQMDFSLEYAMSRKRKSAFEQISVYPPAPGSVWESGNPGVYKMKKTVLTLSLGYRF